MEEKKCSIELERELMALYMQMTDFEKATGLKPNTVIIGKESALKSIMVRAAEEGVFGVMATEAEGTRCKVGFMMTVPQIWRADEVKEGEDNG